jgi:DNA replication protein DnaC
MTSKQENPTENAATVIDRVTKQFRAMGLPLIADSKLYRGMPLTILENFHQALCQQRSVDEEKRFLNRLRYAGISRQRSQNTFKWGGDRYPLAEPGAIESVLDLEFLRDRKNLVVIGPSGAGKSMLVLICACNAIRANSSVKYKTGHDIAVEIKEAKAGNSLSGYIKKLQACDMLIIEDITFANLDNKAAPAFFSVIDRRYERSKTTVVTSNGNINEWAAEFKIEGMSTAILGRFYEGATLVNMNGAQDMRLKQAKDMLENSDKHEVAI